MKYYGAHDYIVNKIQKQKPMLAYDKSKDYNEWKQSAKGKLIELLGMPDELCEDDFAILSDENREGYRQISFEFQSEEGFYIPCELLIPMGKEGPLPTVICLQGHSTGKHVSVGTEMYPGDMDTIAHSDFAIQAINEGYCAVVMDQRYMGATGQDESGTPSCFATNRAMPSLLIGRTALGERVWDVQRLIDVLEKYFSSWVNMERILCLGNSGGGTATLYAACVDERIYMAIPSCAVCTFEESVLPIHHCSCNYIPGIRKYFNMGDIGCLVAPRKLIQVNGIHDHLFWINGARECHKVIKEAYEAVGCTENCFMVEGDGAHQFFPDDVWPIVRKNI